MPMYQGEKRVHRLQDQMPEKKIFNFVPELTANQKAIQGLMAGINKIAEATTAWGAKVSTVHQGLSRLSANLAQANNYTLSWARAGFQGTGQMALWEHHTFLLSRSIASIFIPTLEKLTGIVQKITGWFQSLTSKQQDLFAKVTVVSMVFVAMVGVLPKVSMVLAGVAGAIKLVGAAFSLASGGILPIIGLIVAAIGGLAVGTKSGREALVKFGEFFAKVWKALQPMVERVMDAIGRAYERFFQTVWPMLERLGAVLGRFAKSLGEAMGIEGLAEDFTSFLEVAIELVAKLGTAFTEGVLGAIIASIEGLEDFLAAANRATGNDGKKKDKWSTDFKWYDVLKYGVTGGAWGALDAGNYMWRNTFGYKEGGDGSEGSGRFGVHGKRPTKDAKGRQFAETPGSFGDIGDLFRKIQQTVDGSGGKSPEEETAENTKDLLGIVRDIGGALGIAMSMQKPVVT